MSAVEERPYVPTSEGQKRGHTLPSVPPPNTSKGNTTTGSK